MGPLAQQSEQCQRQRLDHLPEIKNMPIKISLLHPEKTEEIQLSLH